MPSSTPSVRLAALAALFAAVGGAGAQVTPSEPFGGRPFGAAPGTPPPGMQQQQVQPQQQPVIVSPQQPVIVSPQQPVVVAPVQQQAPQAAAQPAPAPAPQPTAVLGAPAQQQGVPPNGTGTARGTAPAPSAPRSAAPAPVAPTAARPANAPSGTQQAARGLPADAPKVVISGSVWSRDPARRLMIVNGQTVREGADLGQGLLLQEVRQDSAVLGYKGNQYNVYF